MWSLSSSRHTNAVKILDQVLIVHFLFFLFYEQHSHGEADGKALQVVALKQSEDGSHLFDPFWSRLVSAKYGVGDKKRRRAERYYKPDHQQSEDDAANY